MHYVNKLLTSTLILSVILSVGCDLLYSDTIRETKKFEKEVTEFCDNLEPEDYYWDCSEWENANDVLNKRLNKTNVDLPEPYEVKCTFDSKRYDNNVFCMINYYFEKIGIERPDGIVDVRWCRGETLEEAFDYCKELPKELENITVIKPR